MDRVNKEKIIGTIYGLEQSLANFESRDIAARALADDIEEYGSSGHVYDKQDVLDMYKTLTNINHEITDYAIEFLSDTVVKATYKSNLDANMALRTSIWKFVNNAWMMSFHQGTAYKD